jgi:type IV secretory pathway VirB10-like protein
VPCASQAVVRVLLGETAGEPPPQLLSHSTEPTLRAVLSTHKLHWPCLRVKPKALESFFAEARRVGSAQRVSKRARVAPLFADEAQPLAKSTPSPSQAKQRSPEARAVARAVRAAARNAAEEELATAERAAKAARRRVREAEEELQRCERTLAESRAAADAAAAAEQEEEEEEVGDDDDEDDLNGTSAPKGVRSAAAQPGTGSAAVGCDSCRGAALIGAGLPTVARLVG